jgi:3-phytase
VKRRRWWPGAAVALAAAALATVACQAPPVSPAARLAPLRVTEPVPDDPDDPAIWRHPTDPSKSLIIGTNKVAAPAGALVVFGLDGRIRQTIAGLDRPNNVDVELGVRLGGAPVDIAVTTERYQHRLRVYAIDAGGSGLTELGRVPVLNGETGDRAEPMGIALYRRPSDGAVFAVVSPKSGGAVYYLWQYRIEGDETGGVRGTLVRRFGAFSERGPEPGAAGEIEAVVADDELGYVYYADERFGIHKWHADPDHADAGRELAVFGLTGYRLDREGLALYAQPGGRGYLVSTDQIPQGTVLKFYPRDGKAGAPHVHDVAFEVATTADETDGIDVTSSDLPGFPGGLLVAMNSAPRNFALFPWNALCPAGLERGCR